MESLQSLATRISHGIYNQIRGLWGNGIGKFAIIVRAVKLNSCSIKDTDVSTIMPRGPRPGNQKTKMKLSWDTYGCQLLGATWYMLSCKGHWLLLSVQGGTWVRAIASHGDFNPNPSITEERY